MYSLAWSQQNTRPGPIEDNVPQALMERADVKDLTRRLTLMRRNFNKMGENHPLYERTLNDIRISEQRLLQLLQDADSMPRARENEVVPSAPRIPRKKALGLESRPPWTPLPIPELRAPTPFALHPMILWSDRGSIELLGEVGEEELLALVLDDASPLCRLVLLRVRDGFAAAREIGRAANALAAVADADFAHTKTVYIAFGTKNAENETQDVEIRELQLLGDTHSPISNQRTIGRMMHRGRLRLKSLFSHTVVVDSDEIIPQSSENDYVWNATTERSAMLSHVNARDRSISLKRNSDRQRDIEIPFLYESASDALWTVDTEDTKIVFSRVDGDSDPKENISLEVGTALSIRDIALESGILSAREATVLLMDRKKGMLYRLIVSDSSGTLEAVCDTTLSLNRFVQGVDNEPWIRDDRGLYYRLAKPREQAVIDLPERLSGLGIYQNIQEDQLKAAFVPYSLRESQPVDHGTKDAGPSRFWIGIPDGRIDYWGKESGIYPSGTIFLQTLYSKAQPARRLVTRILIRQRREWFTYSYQWNDSQSDAFRMEQDLKTKVYDRQDCKRCHLQPGNDFILGFKPSQLAEFHEYSAGELGLQVRTLQHLGMIP